jgi:hypothetical protein
MWRTRISISGAVALVIVLAGLSLSGEGVTAAPLLQIPPTNTQAPPTSTPAPPTNTPLSPSNTPIPSNTPQPSGIPVEPTPPAGTPTAVPYTRTTPWRRWRRTTRPERHSCGQRLREIDW